MVRVHDSPPLPRSSWRSMWWRLPSGTVADCESAEAGSIPVRHPAVLVAEGIRRRFPKPDDAGSLRFAPWFSLYSVHFVDSVQFESTPAGDAKNKPRDATGVAAPLSTE